MAIIYSEVKTTILYRDSALYPVAMSENARKLEAAEKAEREERNNRIMNPVRSQIEAAREADYLRSKRLNESQQSLFANPKYANAKRSEWITIPG